MSKLETNTIDTVSGTTNLTIGSTNTSSITLGASGDTITIPNGALTGQNYPAFYRVKTSNVSITNNTYTRVSFDTERFDTDNAMTSTTFTVPSGKAGKYFFHAACIVDANALTQLSYINSRFYKNGSQVNNILVDFRNNHVQQFNCQNTFIIDLVAGDYMELYIRGLDTSGNPSVNGSSAEDLTYFMGYRIGA